MGVEESEVEEKELEIKDDNGFLSELYEIINNQKGKELQDSLSDYHAGDIADVFPLLEKDKRQNIYLALSDEELSDIFSYLEDPATFVEELEVERAADIIEEMDSGDAVDLLSELDDDTKSELIELLDEESASDVKLISEFDEDEIGSLMTTDYATIDCSMTIKQAMRKVIKDASEIDNISTVFVTDKDGFYKGAIRLRDLVIARAENSLDDIIISSFPHLHGHFKTDDVLDDIKEYAEPSLPVLDDDNRLIGALTSDSVLEAVDEDLSEDYAKLAGLSAGDNEKHSIFKGLIQRLPWLVVLLVLDIFIGAYIGIFEAVVIGIPFIVSFQQLISDMCGNSGTQTLAMTIRMLSDSDITKKEKRKFVFKEVESGFLLGLITGVITSLAVGLFTYLTLDGSTVITALKVAGSVGISLVISTTVSTLTGCLIPITLDKCKIDPAVASGPLITTLNDIVAISLYYGLALLLLL